MGKIYFQGQPVSISSPKVARALGIETVYQDLALVNLMSIARNFFLGREPAHGMGPLKLLDKDTMNVQTVKALGDIGIEIRRPEEEVLRLSGGERQSIAIGRAAHFGQKILILDEPTSALSVGETKKVLSYTLEAKRAGLGVIFITHNIGHVYQVADRFTIISHGQKVGDFMKGEVSPEEISAMIMGGPVPERLVPVIEEREAALRRTRDRISDAAAPITLLTGPEEAAAINHRGRGAGNRVSCWQPCWQIVGHLSSIESAAEATPVPTVDMASVPQEVLDTIDILENDPDPGQRAIAASKLGAPKFQHLASVDPLIVALQDEAWEVRAAAAKSFGRIGDRRAIDPLQPLLRDNNSLVRDAAGEALQVGFGLSCSDANGCQE